MKKLFRALFIFIILVVISFFFLPKYVQKALIYREANIDDYSIFDQRIVEKGKAEPWLFSKNYNDYQFSREDRKELESYNPVAYLIIQNGEIKYEEYWDGYGQNSLSNSFSMSKSIVSLLIGIAIDEGLIKSVDQKVMDFIPEYDKEGNRDLTIRHLLTMSSGLNWDEAYATPFSMTTEGYYGKDLSSLIKSLDVISQPGTSYRYQSGNTVVLGMILEAATNKNISEYASEKLWSKIGAENDAIWSLDNKDGIEKSFCCFNSNARDFARLGQLILNNGLWNNDTIVSTEYLLEATKAAMDIKNNENTAMLHYGYQFWVMNYKDMEIPYFRGILGQYIIPIKEKNAVIIRLGHERSRSYLNYHPMDVYLYIDLALKVLD